MSVLHELYLSGDDKPVSEDGLIWKEILPEGESAYTPTPLGPVRRPFRVVVDGKSDLSSGVVAMQEIVENFNDGAYENVQVILGKTPPKPDGSGGDHEDITSNNTGFVRQLRIDDKPGADGKKRLMAGIEFTEPEVGEKVERGTYANCSSGILGSVLNKHTGKSYNAALKHVAITNSPWIGGMEKFGNAIMASDDDVQSTVAVNLDDPFEEGDAVEVVWDERESASWLRQAVQTQLQPFTEQAAEMGKRAYFWVADVGQDKALVSIEAEEGGGDTFVVPFQLDGDSLQVSSPARWTRTKQVMVAAADELSDDQLRQRVQNALGYSLNLGGDYVVERVGDKDAVVHNTVADQRYVVGYELSANRIWLDPVAEWRRSSGELAPRDAEEQTSDGQQAPAKEGAQVALSDDSPRGRLRAAREKRGLLNNDNDRGGQKMSGLNLDGLNLSDEQRQALEAQLSAQEADQQELERLRAERREAEVDKKIDDLKEIGLSDNPGVLKLLRRIYLSDDNKPTAVLLADDGADEKTVSLTEAFDMFLNALKNQETGRLEFADQGLVNGRRPEDTAEGEISDPTKDLEEAAKFLKLPVPKVAS